MRFEGDYQGAESCLGAPRASPPHYCWKAAACVIPSSSLGPSDSLSGSDIEKHDCGVPGVICRSPRLVSSLEDVPPVVTVVTSTRHQYHFSPGPASHEAEACPTLGREPLLCVPEEDMRPNYSCR